MLVAYPVAQDRLFAPDVDPWDTVCSSEYQLPVGVVHCASAVATTFPAEHVILQSLAVSDPATDEYPVTHVPVIPWLVLAPVYGIVKEPPAQ